MDDRFEQMQAYNKVAEDAAKKSEDIKNETGKSDNEGTASDLKSACKNDKTFSHAEMEAELKKINGDWTSKAGKRKCPNFRTLK